MKHRLESLGIESENKVWVMFIEDKEEIVVHLFQECTWTKKVQFDVKEWTGVHFQRGENETIQMVGGKHWSTIKKKITMAIYGAITYQIWKAKNLKVFQGANVNTKLVKQQVKNVVRGQLEIIHDTKQGRKYTYLIQIICNQCFN